MTQERMDLPEKPNHAAAACSDSVEQRLRRLEDAVALLQDTRRLEERVLERVADRMNRKASSFHHESTAISVDSHRRLLPPPRPFQAEPDKSADYRPPQTEARHPWFILEAYAELRAMVEMFFDRRYRMSWTARLALPIVFLAMLLSWMIVSGIWIIGPILDRAVDLVLAFLAYKVLSREAARYRAAVAGLPKTHRRGSAG